MPFLKTEREESVFVHSELGLSSAECDSSRIIGDSYPHKRMWPGDMMAAVDCETLDTTISYAGGMIGAITPQNYEMIARSNFICFIQPCFSRNQHWVLFNFQFTNDREINVCMRKGDGVVVREKRMQLV